MTRNEVDKKYKWNLSDMVKSADEFEKLFKDVETALPALASYKGKLGDRAAALEFFKLDGEVERKLELIYIWSHMYKDEDAKNGEAMSLAMRTDGLAARCGETVAFIDSELSALDKATLDAYIADPDFAEYDFSLKEVLRRKEHILSDREEALLAMSSDALRATTNVAHMLFDADMKFEPVVKGGKKIELNNSSYGELLGDENREVRKSAFNNLYDGYIAHINTLAANYAGSVKGDNFVARARGYKDGLEMSMFGDGVPSSVYTNLIDAVNKNFAPLHRYIALRKNYSA